MLEDEGLNDFVKIKFKPELCDEDLQSTLMEFISVESVKTKDKI